MTNDLSGHGNIIVFNGAYNVPVIAIRYHELRLVLKNFPGIHIIQPELHEVVPNTVQNAYAQITDVLTKYPHKGDIAAVWQAWDVPQVGATQAIVAADRPDIHTYGVDGSPDVVKMVGDPKSPAAAVVAQQPYLIGKTAVDNVARYLGGDHALPPYTFVPSILVTKENAASAAKALGQN
jgi:ribose transport system substrate-binding protein